ncbi:MAG: VOC family protein [Myxococcales bacterium]|nr:VOC family protein [Myxococcales bacterium]
MNTKLSSLVLRCANIDASRDFYERLGLRFSREKHGEGPEHYATIDNAPLIELYPESPSNDRTRLGFDVADVDAIVERVAASGATVRALPSESPRGRRAVVIDPDGRAVELIESAKGLPPC